MRKILTWSTVARVGLIGMLVGGLVSALSNGAFAFLLWRVDVGVDVTDSELGFLELFEVFVGLQWLLLGGANITVIIGLIGLMITVNRYLAEATEQASGGEGLKRGDTAWIVVGWIIPLVGVFVLPERLARQIHGLNLPNSDALRKSGNAFIVGLLIAGVILRLTDMLSRNALELSDFVLVFGLEAVPSLGYAIISLLMLKVVGAFRQSGAYSGSAEGPTAH